MLVLDEADKCFQAGEMWLALRLCEMGLKFYSVYDGRALREELQGLGYKFTSQTDSEVIVHLIHHYLTAVSDLLEAVRQAVRRLDGAYALAVIATGENERILLL